MQERPSSQPGRVLLISLLAAGLLVTAVTFAGGSIIVRAVPRRQTSITDLTDTADAQTSDAADTADAQTFDAADTADAQTAAVEDTAAAQTDAAPSTTLTPTSTATGTGMPAASTSTPTSSSPVRRVPLPPTSPPLALSPTIASTRAPIDPPPTLVENVPSMPTPLLGDTLTCTPGLPIVLSGSGPAHAAFLLYFGTRVVGGGSVAANGRFTANLVVGNERAGDYAVVVRVRGTSQILLRITCGVPVALPTAQPQQTASG